jgi:hypothetical protein
MARRHVAERLEHGTLHAWILHFEIHQETLDPLPLQ